MENEEELKQMILNFRVTELHLLLTFAGRNKFGRKAELQNRALELLKINSSPFYEKIRKLHQALQLSILNNPLDASSKISDSVATTEACPTTMQPNRNYTGYPAPAVNRALMYGNIYPHQQQYPVRPAIPTPQYPIHPDVKLKRLPFYDFIGELIKPSTLVPNGNQRQQEQNFVFHLTPIEAEAIAEVREVRLGTRCEHDNQVQLRFCLLETTSEQEDCFPPGIMVKVNQKVCTLPNPIPPNKPSVEPKRPPRPVNITSFVKLSPVVANHVTVQWSMDYSRGYVMTVHLVNKKTADELLTRLKSKGLRAADYTRGMIKDKLKEDGEIATTSLRVSLACPLGKMRMTTPCRASTCNHFQCFDAALFIKMNEKKPQWVCPVCNKPAVYDKLVIDGYFQEVLESPKLPASCSEIQLNMDGAWSVLLPNIKDPSCVVEHTPVKVELVKVESVVQKLEKELEVKDNVQIVTLSDSDDEPLVRRKTVVEEPKSEPVATSSGELPTKLARLNTPPSVITLDEDSPVASPSASAPLQYASSAFGNYLNSDFPYK